MHKRFNFEVDLCSSPHLRIHKDLQFYTQSDPFEHHIRELHGKRIWCNPPFSKIGTILHHLAKIRFQELILCVPEWTRQPWWTELISRSTILQKYPEGSTIFQDTGATKWPVCIVQLHRRNGMLRLPLTPHLDALVDTGAARSCVQPDALAALGLSHKDTFQIQKINLLTANGASMPVDRAVRLPIPGTEPPLKTVALVVPDLHHRVILGMPFMREAKPLIQWDTLEIRIPKRAVAGNIPGKVSGNFHGDARTSTSQDAHDVWDLAAGFGTTMMSFHHHNRPIHYRVCEKDPVLRNHLKQLYSILQAAKPAHWLDTPAQVFANAQDVKELADQCSNQHMHYLCCGVPCQPFSRANPLAKGLKDPRELFSDVNKLILNNTVDNWLVECVPFHAKLNRDYKKVCSWFGSPQVIDFGQSTGQQRTRLCWSNNVLDVQPRASVPLTWRACLDEPPRGHLPDKSPTIMARASTWNNHRQESMNAHEKLRLFAWTPEEITAVLTAWSKAPGSSTALHHAIGNSFPRVLVDAWRTSDFQVEMECVLTILPQAVQDPTPKETLASSDPPKAPKFHDPEVQQLLDKYSCLFEKQTTIPPSRGSLDFKLRFKPDSRPYKTRGYRQTPAEEAAAAEQVKKRLAKGQIERIQYSRVCSPVLFAKGKSGTHKDGQLRMVIDYRKANAACVAEMSPIPNVNEVLAALAKSKVFSIFDQAKAFHQVRCADKDTREALTFVVSGQLYCPTTMDYGIQSAAGVMQRHNQYILSGCYTREDFAHIHAKTGYTLTEDDFEDLLAQILIYIDDIILHTTSEAEHKILLRKFLKRFWIWGIYLNPDPVLFADRIEPLGFQVGHGYYAPKDKEIPLPVLRGNQVDRAAVKRFLGMIGYYRPCIPRFSQIAGPLFQYEAGTQAWNDGMYQHMEQLSALLRKQIRTYVPTGAPLYLYTDASEYGLGGILVETDDKVPEGEMPTSFRTLGFYSSKFNSAQSKYPVFDQEFLAFLKTMRNFRYIVQGRHVEARTDHKPLVQYLKKDVLELENKRRVGWLDILSSYEFNLTYIPGEKNTIADYLSRVDPFPGPSLSPAQIQERTSRQQTADSRQQTDTTLAAITEQDSLPQATTTSIDDLTTLVREVHSFYHRGVAGTYALVAREHPHPSLRRICQEVVGSCPLCQQAKVTPTRNKTAWPQVPVSPLPMTAVEIDILEDRRDSEYPWILGFKDRLTGYVVLFPLAETRSKAKHIVLDFLDGFWCFFGCPRVIYSDLDRRFVSELFQELAKTLGIQTKVSAPYHKGLTSRVERSFRTAREFSRILALKYGTTFSSACSVIQFVLNSTPDKNGFTPFFKLMGYEPNPGLAVSLNGHQLSRETLAALRDKLFSQMKDSADSYYTSIGMTKWHSLKAGLYVLIKTNNPTRSELPYDGPFQILEVDRYNVWVMKGKTKVKVPFAKVKLWHGDLPSTPHKWQVYSFLKKRGVSPNQEVQVRWQNSKQTTWEPVTHLMADIGRDAVQALARQAKLKLSI